MCERSSVRLKTCGRIKAYVFHKTLIMKETCASQSFSITMYQLGKHVGNIRLAFEVSYSSHYALA